MLRGSRYDRTMKLKSFYLAAFTASFFHSAQAQGVFNEMSYSPEQTVFTLKAPVKPVVRIYPDAQNLKASKTVKMKRAGENVWKVAIKGDLKNKFYTLDRKSTRLNSSHANISYAVFCLKKKNKITY